MIGIANSWMRRRPSAKPWIYYAGLLVTLALNAAMPLDIFLGLPETVQGLAAGGLALSPVFFAGAIFAILLRNAKRPEQALAFNTAGALIGGFTENVSLLVGFNYLMLVAAAIYCASWVFTKRSLSRTAASRPVVGAAAGG